MLITDFIDRLERVKRTASGWTARCPAHQDRSPSLHVAAGDDGRILVRCHAGCTAEQIVAALGLDLADLFDRPNQGGGGASPRRSPATPQRSSPPSAGGEDRPPAGEAAAPERSQGLTLEAYAALKGLSAEFLRSVDVAEISWLGRPVVRIPYIDSTGTEIGVRFRIAAEGDKFRWRKGSKLGLYGIPRLGQARDVGYVALVEGESDCQTLWNAGYPAVGLPGATQWKEDRDAPALEGIGTIYLVVEADQGGESLLRTISASSICDRVKLVSLPTKDVSAMWLLDPGCFRDKFEAALQSATPLAERKRLLDEIESQLAWEECGELANEPRILDTFAATAARTGLAGEERVARILYLALTSRFLSRPVSVAVKGPSAGGKSFTVERVLDFMPNDAYYSLTSMSERALAYDTEPLAHRFLVLFEAAGMESDFASYLIRSLLSEGRLRYLTVDKVGGQLEARMVEREGPTGLLVTTTRTGLHPENETRLLSLTVHDTPEQTKRVLAAIASEAEPVDLSAWQSLQTWLTTAEHQVAIPYAQKLAELVPPVAVRLRRDFGAVLSLVRSHAILHQASRERDAAGRIVATQDDYAVVRDLVLDLVGEGVTAAVSATVRETVAAVTPLLNAQPFDGDMPGVSVRQLADKLGLDKSAASRRWTSARDLGYLTNAESRKGRPARILLGDPLPDDVEVLPPVEALSGDRCAVAREPEGNEPLPLPQRQLTDETAQIAIARLDTLHEDESDRPAGTEHDGEAGILAELAEIAEPVSEGVAELVGDDHEFVVTEVIEPGLIEIGYVRPRPGACGYAAHRPTDWIASDGRVVCGICHPPTPNARGARA
jgi:hypothetical protein